MSVGVHVFSIFFGSQSLHIPFAMASSIIPEASMLRGDIGMMQYDVGTSEPLRSRGEQGKNRANARRINALADCSCRFAAPANPPWTTNDHLLPTLALVRARRRRVVDVRFTGSPWPRWALWPSPTAMPSMCTRLQHVLLAPLAGCRLRKTQHASGRRYIRITNFVRTRDT
jgi:hypothetical protein